MDLTSLLLLVGLTFLPTAEGRYAILYAFVNGYPLWTAFIVASAGVVMLAFFLAWFIGFVDVVIEFIVKHGGKGLGGFVERVYRWYRNRAMQRSRRVRGELLLLILFVAAPFPGTGMWTGSLVGHLSGMNRKNLFLALLIGGLTSNVLVYIMVQAGIRVWGT
ncbi:MAG: small multi-drug export protein [Desulfurococcales archaeon]|nr:small multi-drug export protein [Desulfurococcales archaeon]